MSTAATQTWKLCQFDQLTTRELYQLAKLRIDVFVVEQRCAYPELDGLDLLSGTAHLFALEDAQPVTYARVLAPTSNTSRFADAHSACVHIGRVLVAQSHRRRGLATELMQRALEHCRSHHKGHAIALAAQVDVMAFYTSLGFTPCSAHYIEDGIAHVDMQLENP